MRKTRVESSSAHDQDQDRDVGAEHREHEQREDQGREGHQQVDQTRLSTWSTQPPHDRREEAERHADREGRDDVVASAMEMVSARAKDHARQQVAAEIVGAEPETADWSGGSQTSPTTAISPCGAMSGAKSAASG